MKTRIWSAVLALLASYVAGAETPSVLNEAAMWLDASDPAYFVHEPNGGVQTWINRSASGRATYGDATAFQLDTRALASSGSGMRYGALTTYLGAPCLDMLGTGSYVDLTFTRISTIRTVFLVGTFTNDNKLEPLLGDDTYRDFHRGGTGQMWSKKWASENNGWTGTLTCYLNSATTTCNAESTTPVANACNIIMFESSINARANSLGSDRKITSRNAGRTLHEVLIFTRTLTAAERTAVYNYLDAKWKQNGWNTGAYNVPAQPLTVSDDTTVETGKPALFGAYGAVTVPSGKTVTVNDFASGKSITLGGSGTLDLVGGASFSGWLTQTNSTLRLGGGGIFVNGNPSLTGSMRWENGTVDVSFTGEFRPPAGTTLTLGDGGRVVKRGGGRTFIDKGNVTLNLESGSLFDVAGPFNVSIDSATKNYLNINGGTLVVTNRSDASAAQNQAVTIGSQQATSGSTVGEGFMTMTSGRIIAGKLRAAAAWNGTSANVKAHGTITVGGGTIELLDRLELGTSSSTRGLATVTLNGGEITSVNGVDMYADDIDTLTLNGVTFHALVDTAPYFNLRKSSGANTSLGDNGFTMDVASGKTVRLGWGFKGTGGITKSGAGTLTLDQAATFTGGLTVSEGTAILSTTASAGTGTIRLAAGATLTCEAIPVTGTLAADAQGTLVVVAQTSGKQVAMPTALTALPDGLTVVVKDSQGTVLPSATASVEGGKLYVTAPDAWTADVADATTADWYALAWQQGGASKTFPTTAGTVMDAILTVAGTSTISLGSDVHAGNVVYTNAASATTTLTGAGTLDASLDVTGFTGDFRLDGVDVAGTISYGANKNLVLWADAGEEWTNTLALAGTGVVRKGGAGTVVWPTYPSVTVEATDGVLAFIEASNVSRSSNILTGSGTKEKRGAGTLTVTGGSWPGNWRVTEGTLSINNAFTSAGTGIYVGKGARIVVPHCSQVNNRLPYNAQVVVDGGTFEVGGVNPFKVDGGSAQSPDFFVTNGTFSVLNTTGSEHIKFESLTLKDSSFIIKGTKGAYSKNAIYMYPAPCTITSDGAVSMTFESASCPNSLAAAAAITLAVNSGTNLFAVSTLQTINKTGAGMIRFPSTVANNSTAWFNVKEGSIGGGQIKYLNIAAGTTIVVDETNPLTVTTGLALPSAGSTPIAIDVSGIDFTDRTKEVVVIKGLANTSDYAKFACAGLPDGWQIVSGSGVFLRKVSADAEQALSWTTGDGTWSASDWNNGTEYVDGYHSVTFAEGANAATTVTLDGDRAVRGLTFSATNTFYTLTGASGSLRTSSFALTGTGGFSIGVPLFLETAGLTFETTTADQEILDIRNTVGAVNIPAAAGGKALLAHTDASPRVLAGITIGSGKTFEWRNNSTAANKSSLYLSSPIVGDASTKLVITAPQKADTHIDIKQNCPNFKGQLEIKDGGWVYIEAQFDQATATKENPVWVHGEGSCLKYYGKQNGNRFPVNGWIKVTDGGTFIPTGVNPTQQVGGPYIVLSNGTTQVASSSGSTIHTSDVYLEGNSTFALTGTANAYQYQGVVIHGTVYVPSGASDFTRSSGSNYAKFWNAANTAEISGTFDVAVGAKLTLSCALSMAPIKAGAGDLELAGAFTNSAAKTITINAGYLVANEMANLLTTVTAANGAGFNLTAEDACYTPTNGVALAAEASARLNLKTGTRELELDEYLVRWTSGKGPSCSFRLVSEGEQKDRWTLVRAADGVKVGRRSFVILLR